MGNAARYIAARKRLWDAMVEICEFFLSLPLVGGTKYYGLCREYESARAEYDAAKGAERSNDSQARD